MAHNDVLDVFDLTLQHIQEQDGSWTCEVLEFPGIEENDEDLARATAKALAKAERELLGQEQARERQREQERGRSRTSHSQPKKAFSFTVRVFPDDGLFVAECSGIDGGSQGATAEEAVSNLTKALEMRFGMTSPKDFDMLILTLSEETTGRWACRVREFPGVMGHGVTREDAFEDALTLAMCAAAGLKPQ